MVVLWENNLHFNIELVCCMYSEIYLYSNSKQSLTCFGAEVTSITCRDLPGCKNILISLRALFWSHCVIIILWVELLLHFCQDIQNSHSRNDTLHNFVQNKNKLNGTFSICSFYLSLCQIPAPSRKLNCWGLFLFVLCTQKKINVEFPLCAWGASETRRSLPLCGYGQDAPQPLDWRLKRVQGVPGGGSVDDLSTRTNIS